jgi:hypothetical protein
MLRRRCKLLPSPRKRFTLLAEEGYRDWEGGQAGGVAVTASAYVAFN